MAAVVHRGRQSPALVALPVGTGASMWPRLFTAEDQSHFTNGSAALQASMWPRLFTAEDGRFSHHVISIFRASMWPRLFTAEDCRVGVRSIDALMASMWPRLFTAEDCRVGRHNHWCQRCFNVAAVVHRGRRLLVPVYTNPGLASMWPRLFTAEDTAGTIAASLAN